MEWTIYIVPLTTVLAMFIANGALIIPMFLWNRSEANADRRAILAMIDAIQKEMKDFHERLLKIELERK